LRLEKCLKIARNALVVGVPAQDLAAKSKLDTAVFSLITLCIKVTARGYADGEEAHNDDEDKWQMVIDLFKRLLGTCLQFVNNLVVQNENRKLSLWVELFDSGNEIGLADGTADGIIAIANSGGDSRSKQTGPETNADSKSSKAISKAGKTASTSTETHKAILENDLAPSSQPLNHPFLLYFIQMNSEVSIRSAAEGSQPGTLEIAEECRRRWGNCTDEEKKLWLLAYKNITGHSQVSDVTPSTTELISAINVDMRQRLKQLILDQILRPSNLKLGNGTSSAPVLHSETSTSTGKVVLDIGKISIDFGIPHGAVAEPEDYQMTYDAAFGEDLLRQGKNELLKRLEPESARSSVNLPGQTSQASASPAELPDTPIEQHPLSGNQGIQSEAEEEDDDDSEGDFMVPGDNGRGLLTDVPLILGPGEIEVLPMIIQSGIVPPSNPAQPGYGNTADEMTTIKNMHYVRCHLLLAQENGRNLLRELLIFVAAWDLREDELYFKIMASIMEAILLSGLLPYSYQSFREPKDIVSPAQAVIMKLLTNIFGKRRAEQEQPKVSSATESQIKDTAATSYPQKVEVQMVRTLLTEFRRVIIPQVCAIVFCQGQIRGGFASSDEFPLNLWDMERMYEGIYQYLEFFATLTEHSVWKKMLAEWMITTELITLIEELDAAIPRSTLKTQSHNGGKTAKDTASMTQSQGTSGVSTTADSIAAPQTPVSVERPYDPIPDEMDADDTVETPTNVPTVPKNLPHHSSDNYPAGPTEDEPCNFEWRNLKKLAVLVLSSLVWQNPKAQEQMGAPDKQGLPGRGLRALLSCCRTDDFNPYVREHAVLAIRFALEGSEQNQKIFSDLQAQSNAAQNKPKPAVNKAVSKDQAQASSTQEKMVLDGVEIPKEVLDLNGYEICVDEAGHRHLRKRVGPSS
jgi:palmitoyltransferase